MDNDENQFLINELNSSDSEYNNSYLNYTNAVKLNDVSYQIYDILKNYCNDNFLPILDDRDFCANDILELLYDNDLSETII